MFLTTVLPRSPQIVARGGPGREAWGHPLEPTAQYNHSAEGRALPPICPWRIEVSDTNRGTSTLFLHVFEITDEAVRQPSEVTFVAPAGVNIGGRGRVSFNSTGFVGGSIDSRPLATTIRTELQYSTSAH
jgi:hypothetical protein